MSAVFYKKAARLPSLLLELIFPAGLRGKHKSKPRAQCGFTLIQISILLTVASLALVTVLPSQTTPLKKSSDTVTNLNTLLTELRKFQAAYGYLPCPSDASQPISAANYGVAATNAGASGNCAGGTPAANFSDGTNHVAIGMVPVRTLGIANAYALDSFGRDVTYAVDTNATVCWSQASLTGQIAVADNGTTYNTVAALVSHGADGHGAWLPLAGSTGTAQRLNAGSTDTDQLVNAHLTTGTFPTSTASSLVTDAAGATVTFVRKPGTPTFDDMVVYKSPLWTMNNEPLAIQNSVPIVTPPANGTYSSGQTISFTLTYSSAVTVNTGGGTPYLALSALGSGSIGTSNLAKATYQSGSGTTALVFSYTVAVADTAPTGLTVASPINLGGGSLSIGSGCLLTFTAPNLSGVIIANYVYARSITIDYTKVSTASQTNFPVLVSGTYSYLATATNSGYIQNTTTLNGQTVPADLIFTSDNACTTKLNWEIASYTATTGAIEAWVQVPTLSYTANTVIYMCYDNTAVTTYQSTASSTWDSYYAGVWHLPNGTTLSVKDSTNNANNGTDNGATVTTGEIDGAASFNGSTNYIDIGSGASLNITSAITMSAWIKIAASGAYYHIIGGYQGSSPNPGYGFIVGGVPGSTTDGHLAYWSQTHGVWVEGHTAVNNNTLHLVEVTVTGTTVQFYIDGAADGAAVSSNQPSSYSGDRDMGRGENNASYWSGTLDEVRVSSTARSAGWITSEYNNQSSPDKATYGSSGFYAIGAATTP